MADILAKEGSTYKLDFNRTNNRWVQDGNTERRSGFQRPSITRSRENRHVTRMAVSDRAAPSRALNQELESFARLSVSTNSSTTFAAAWTLSSETIAAATLDAASPANRLQWCDQRRTWTPKWPDATFSDESGLS
ncbi:UNVERIFIED_CONTAM: hypothetical protein NCL1_31938 [Trichonephila clavipes]